MTFEYDFCIGRKIRDIRMSKGFTQEQLSAQLQVHDCDITRDALAKIECGLRHIYCWEIKAFKEVLNVSYDDLFV